MSKLLSTGHRRIALQVCVAGALAALMSGCSSDVTRFGDPFGNPFSTASSDQVQPRRHLAGDVIPAGRTPPVTSSALAPRSSVASLAPARPAFQTAARQPVSNETTGSIEAGPARIAPNSSFGGWSSAGGTPIQVADGDTADILSKRYGVPTAALLQTNGLRSAAEVRPGSRITIPLYSASNQRAAQVAEAAPKPVAASKPVAALQPLPTRAPAASKLASRKVVEKTVAEVQPARAAKPQHLAEVKTPVGAKQVVKTAEMKASPLAKGVKPLGTLVATKSAAAPVAPHAQTQTAQVQAVPLKPVKGASKQSTVVAQAAPAVATPAPAAPAPAPAVTAENNPEFRWPARGRIIQGFKGGSGGNDGINIAVPEGTSVKAAEGGVVAYAGSELKGYGNLILIRHPNGFVSAYANNGEIDVKRGESVKRGQEIAKSGQSGNVSSPQLHFELRKGSTPVDPTQYLAGL